MEKYDPCKWLTFFSLGTHIFYMYVYMYMCRFCSRKHLDDLLIFMQCLRFDLGNHGITVIMETCNKNTTYA
jgi:hypothetical protein